MIAFRTSCLYPARYVYPREGNCPLVKYNFWMSRNDRLAMSLANNKIFFWEACFYSKHLQSWLSESKFSSKLLILNFWPIHPPFWRRRRSNFSDKISESSWSDGWKIQIHPPTMSDEDYRFWKRILSTSNIDWRSSWVAMFQYRKRARPWIWSLHRACQISNPL